MKVGSRFENVVLVSPVRCGSGSLVVNYVHALLLPVGLWALSTLLYIVPCIQRPNSLRCVSVIQWSLCRCAMVPYSLVQRVMVRIKGGFAIWYRFDAVSFVCEVFVCTLSGGQIASSP